MLTKPAVSAALIAFVYAGDLWTTDLSGRNPRRLTVTGGVEDSLSGPTFSPDGSTLAFTMTRNANPDVYVMPAAGGTPARLTWHPGRDLVQQFTPDGSAVMFVSDRAARFYTEFNLFTVPVADGFEQPLPMGTAFRAVYSPDGDQLAYNPWPDAFDTWKGYRGGRESVIWIARLSDLAVVTKIPQPQGGCNDVDATWLDGKIYFRSDREGEFNLFVFDPATSRIQRLTQHADFPVLGASAGAGRVVYEQAGTLHLYEPTLGAAGPGRDTALAIRLDADLPGTRESYVKGADFLRGATLSPAGTRAAFEMRGDIVTVPAAQGDAHNLTNTPGVYENTPAWSPDGTKMAFLSDETGEFQLHLRDAAGGGLLRVYPLQGGGYYQQLTWSPDGTKVAYADESWTLYWLDVTSGGISKVVTDEYFDAGIPLQFAWAPDSGWIAYCKNDPSRIQSLYLYSLETLASTRVTDGMAEVSSPAFDAGGRFLYFLGSTNAGPTKGYMDMSAQDMQRTDSLYLAMLQANTPSPLARRNDQEPGAGGSAPAPPVPSTPLPPGGRVRIDLLGLAERIQALPLAEGVYKDLRQGPAGQVYYLKERRRPEPTHWPTSIWIRWAKRPSPRTWPPTNSPPATGRCCCNPANPGPSSPPPARPRPAGARWRSTASRSAWTRGRSGRRCTWTPGASTATTSTIPA